ncbi:MAG: hypothetical protein J5521_00670 [Lachnospiraceae bacterium]|nr:hypothetical protein [Lachnospiraceae bacterium]MBR4414939.1 hypothetical protein [Aeriscardovia sp.]
MKKEVRTNELLPINLQFFAEDAAEGADEGSVSTDGDAKSEPDEGEPSKSYEDALSEIAAAKAEAKKLKAERDAALKKTGEISKQLRAKMSEDELKAEQDAQAKEEKEAHIKELEQYKAENEALKRYRLQGMSDELATKAAKAEIEGDMDALADVQKQHTQSLIKAKEAEWKASRPRVNVGDDEDSSMTKEEILAIQDRDERTKAIAKNLALFTQKA